MSTGSKGQLSHTEGDEWAAERAALPPGADEKMHLSSGLHFSAEDRR